MVIVMCQRAASDRHGERYMQRALASLALLSIVSSFQPVTLGSHVEYVSRTKQGMTLQAFCCRSWTKDIFDKEFVDFHSVTTRKQEAARDQARPAFDGR